MNDHDRIMQKVKAAQLGQKPKIQGKSADFMVTDEAGKISKEVLEKFAIEQQKKMYAESMQRLQQDLMRQAQRTPTLSGGILLSNAIAGIGCGGLLGAFKRRK